MINTRTLCLVALAATVSMLSTRALAQDDALAADPFAACLTACDAYVNADAVENEADPVTITDVIAQCRSLEACAAIDAAAMAQVGRICEGAATRSRAGRGSRSGSTSLAACVLPDGSVTTDEGRRRCGCPDGTYPIQASPHRSSDRLRSTPIPRGHSVFVCYNPLAPRGAPGSADERRDALASTVEAHDAALRALCAPDEGEELTAACTRARQERLATGPTDGSVDLDPVMRAIAALQETDEELHEEIEGAVDAVSTLSRRVDVLAECLVRGAGHAVSFTDSTGVTQEYACPDVIAAASERALREARDAAETIGREAGRDAAREEIARSGGSRSENFAMLQAYGLTTFNSLRYANADYDVLFAFGAELSFGIGLGGGWNVHGGIGVGYGGPDLPDVTNVQGSWHAGFGAWVDHGVMIGFGILGTHRFRPDVFSVHSVYGPYLDATVRFFPREEWTPVATIRGFVGASPRWNGSVWNVEADGGLMALLGLAHF